MEPSTPHRFISIATLKKALRRLSWALLGLIIIVAVVFGIGVMVNANDAALRPEVKALMVPPTYRAEPDKNGYFVLVGMDADEQANAAGTGQAIVQEQFRLFQENPNRSDYAQKTVYKKAPQPSWDMNHCKPMPQNCVEADLQNRKKLEDGLSHDALYLRRYQLIQQLPDFEEQVLPSTFAPLPSYVSLARGSDMTLTKAAFDIADGRMQDGVAAIVKNDQFLRRMLKQTTTLIGRMVTLNMLKKQARVVSELVETYPALTDKSGDTLAAVMQPLGPEYRTFTPTFANEARAILGVVQHVEVSHSMDYAFQWAGNGDNTLNYVNDRLLGLFFQRNATLNAVGSWWKVMLQEADRAPAEYDVARAHLYEKAKQLTDPDTPPYMHLTNPVGRILISLSVDPYIYLKYMERGADIDGYMRLVGLQIDLRRKKIAADAVQNYVAGVGEQFRSPYDGKPMKWDPAKKQLQFTGRQPATGNLDEGRMFVAQMR